MIPSDFAAIQFVPFSYNACYMSRSLNSLDLKAEHEVPQHVIISVFLLISFSLGQKYFSQHVWSAMSSIYLGFGVLTPGIVKTSIFWAKPQCSPFKVKGRPRGLQNISMQPVATRFMLPGLFFDHKDGGCMFLQNVVCHSADKCRYLFIPCSSLWSSGRGYRPYKGQVNLLKIHIVVT